MEPWNHWYHVNGNTYGTWLPGDPRGWRSYKHKRHVEGEYVQLHLRSHAPRRVDLDISRWNLLADDDPSETKRGMNVLRRDREENPPGRSPGAFLVT